MVMSFDRRTLLQSVSALGAVGLLPRSAHAAEFAGANEIRVLIAERVAAQQLPGAVVALGFGAEPPEYVSGGTLALDSPVKVDENTLWRLASMTKPVAGLAGMFLVAKGKLGLDQPVADFIPAFATMRVIADPKTSESRPAERLITIRHLVTHTSGIVNDPAGTIGAAYAGLGVAGVPWGAPPPADGPRSLKDYANRLAQVPLTADPGTIWQYSPNLDILARVIEVVSGLPFDVFLERRMFRPLGMASTGFWVRRRDRHRLVTSYARKDGQLVINDPGLTSRLLTKPDIPRASGGLISTARDYDRFLAMIVGGGKLDGQRVLPAEAVRIGTSNLLPPGTDMSQYTGRTGYDGFGAGGMVTTGGLRPGTFGWGGAAGTAGFANAQLGTRWATYTNIGASDFARRAMAAARMSISEAIMPGGAERAPTPPK